MGAQYIKLLRADHLAPSFDSHIVGRQRELTLISNQYEAAKSGYARVVLLTGELGIGKTRLLEEFAGRAVGDGATVLRGSASESEGMPPYLPFLEALGQYIRVTPLHKLSEQIAVAPQMLISILPELAVRLGEVQSTHPLLPEQTRLRLYEAIGMFLEAISASGVLVLALDDLHWADTSSLDLLCYIVRHHTKVKLLIVGTYREGEVDGNPALKRATNELVRQHLLTNIAVDPLSPVESEALAVSHLGSSISPTLSQLLYTQSEGNPFFAEELLQGWIERGALAQENNQWVAVEPLEQSLPASVVGALRQRFAQLPSNVIDHLRIAAVIGQTFDLSLLASVEGQEAEAIEEQLLAAERARLVKADQDGIFKFSHGKIRQCLYTEVSTSRRQRLHEAIGRTLEARYEQGHTKSTFQLAELAFHFTHSGDRQRGAAYSQLAAEQAMRSSAHKEAMTHYQTALKLLHEGESGRGTLLTRLGETSLLVGLVSEAALTYKAALAWFVQAENYTLAAQAAYKLGLVQWRQGDVHAARTAFEHALTLLSTTRSVEVVRVLVDFSLLITLYIGHQAEGLAFAQQALEMARLLEDESLEVAANRVMAVNVYICGNDVVATSQLLEQTLVLAEAHGDFCQAAECHSYLTITHFCKAEIRRAHTVNIRGREFAKRSRQQSHLPYAYSWRALLLASQGAWADAEHTIEHALTFVDSQFGPVLLTFLHQVRGFLAYQREEYETAEQEFLSARENQHSGSNRLLGFTDMLGMTQIALGKRDDASANLVELELHLATLPTGSVATAPILTFMAVIALALGDQERVEKLYPRLQPFSGQYYGCLVDRVLGEMASLLQNWETARLHLSTAWEKARREELRPELARILLRQADLEMKCGIQGSETRTRDLLNHSLVLCEELNMIGSASQVNHRLHALVHRLDNTVSHSLPADLTLREAKVLQLVVAGKSNRQIAHELGISEKTVANHLSHIFNKTISENRAAAAAFAIRNGLA